MATIRVNQAGNGIGRAGNDIVLGDNRDNVIGGQGGNDVLYGQGGHDVIVGGAGNDKLYGGNGNDALAGSSGNDTLYGGSGNDILAGSQGHDTLVGGAGSDFFAFDMRPSINNIDTIDDFSVKADTILLDKKVFKVSADSTGFIKSSAIWIGSAAHDSDDRIIYDNFTGALYYDPDGIGAKAAVQFAQLDANLKLTHKDFLML